MPDPLGVSFMPDAQGSGNQQQNGQRPSPVQQAIKTLSLRIPRTVGAASGAPQELLNGVGGAGLMHPNSAAMLEQIRRMLFGHQPGRFQGPRLPRDPSLPTTGAPFPMPDEPRDPDMGGTSSLGDPNVSFGGGDKGIDLPETPDLTRQSGSGTGFTPPGERDRRI